MQPAELILAIDINNALMFVFITLMLVLLTFFQISEWKREDLIMARPDSQEPYPLGACECITSTAKALRVVMEDDKEFWIPKSVIHDDSEVYDDSANSTGQLVVMKWWAIKEGMCEEDE